MTETKTGVRYNILLAEDDEVNQEIISAFLAGSDLDLTIASDGRQALETALLRKFDLMIVDQNMPFITGDRVVRHLRAGRSFNSETPVIRFTAAADARPIDFGRLVGQLEVTLAKPLSRDALLSTIRALLSRL